MRKGRFHNLHVVVVLILCLSFMLAVFGVFSVNADSTDHEEVYELIILLDRSQSIYSTDTKNVSVDCLKALPDVCPTGTRLYVTVICYWNACKVVLDGVDVKTEAGKQKLVDACESIKADTKHHGTRTGSALKKAYDIISTTKRPYEPDRQAVILFTDGDVNVYGSTDGMTLAEEMALGEENVQKMAALDIPLFCYGLSFGNNGISAKGEAWLRKLCEMSGEGNGKSNCRICSKADDIDYNSVYTFLSEMSEIPAVEITGGKELYLHGEVVQEANIVLHCPKRFREVYLKTPSGKTVVAVNYSTGESSVDSAICSVSDTGNRSAVTVKLVAGGAPLETGNWYVSFKSEEEGGTATLRVLTLYQDLGLNVNGANHAVIGSTLNIYSHITDTMQQQAAARIDREIAGADTPIPEPNVTDKASDSEATDQLAEPKFEPYKGKIRKPGTGCVTMINDHLYEGRFSPRVNGKRIAKNIYATTREECEEKLKALIAEMKKEIAEIKANAKNEG